MPRLFTGLEIPASVAMTLATLRGGVTGAQLLSNEQVTESGSGRTVVKFTVDADWSANP